MNKIFEQGQPAAAKPTFLARLRSDVAGNTLMLVAGAILPLTAMIGAGVDMSRTYLVKSRLQQACDAGALATRKRMGGESTLSTAAQTLGSTFFANNFPTGTFGTGTPSFSTALDAQGQIMASASVRVPQTIMTVFGNSFTDLTVRCDAKLEVSNTDVMFVLDVTGSMADCPDGSTCNGGSTSKIAGLRTAVMRFYDTLSSSAPSSAQLRFGFVPYSTTVNLGSILPADNYNSSYTVQSVVANMNTRKFLASYGPASAPTVEVFTFNGVTGASISQQDCARYGRNESFSFGGSSNAPAYSFTGASNPVIRSGGPAPNSAVTRRYYNNPADGIDRGYPGARDREFTYQSCRRYYTESTTTYTTGFTFTNWTYKPVVYDTSNFKNGNSISVANSAPRIDENAPNDEALNGYVITAGEYNLQQLASSATAKTTNISTTWNRCIEERDTVANPTFTYNAGTRDYTPDGANDLEIDTLPTDNATRWRTLWPEVARYRNGTDAEDSDTLSPTSDMYSPCPAAAARLATFTRAQVQTYVDSLIPTGNTYHDIGMVWGARLISPSGMFASSNLVGANGKPIARNIVFMTDGEMCPSPGVYGFQGIESLSKRVVGNNGTGQTDCNGRMTNRHNSRFLAICAAAKALDINVFTVAFGTARTTQLTACADPGQDLVASDSAALSQAFEDIAAKIADLRLSR
jgi:Flp pilus assembly protein TadG